MKGDENEDESTVKSTESGGIEGFLAQHTAADQSSPTLCNLNLSTSALP